MPWLTPLVLSFLAGYVDTPWRSLRETVWLVGSFFMGCLLAIPMTNHFNNAALLVPGAVLGLRLLLSQRLRAGELP